MTLMNRNKILKRFWIFKWKNSLKSLCRSASLCGRGLSTHALSRHRRNVVVVKNSKRQADVKLAVIWEKNTPKIPPSSLPSPRSQRSLSRSRQVVEYLVKATKKWTGVSFHENTVVIRNVDRKRIQYIITFFLFISPSLDLHITQSLSLSLSLSYSCQLPAAINYAKCLSHIGLWLRRRVRWIPWREGGGGGAPSRRAPVSRCLGRHHVISPTEHRYVIVRVTWLNDIMPGPRWHESARGRPTSDSKIEFSRFSSKRRQDGRGWVEEGGRWGDFWTVSLHAVMSSPKFRMNCGHSNGVEFSFALEYIMQPIDKTVLK